MSYMLSLPPGSCLTDGAHGCATLDAHGLGRIDKDAHLLLPVEFVDEAHHVGGENVGAAL